MTNRTHPPFVAPCCNGLLIDGIVATPCKTCAPSLLAVAVLLLPSMGDAVATHVC